MRHKCWRCLPSIYRELAISDSQLSGVAPTLAGVFMSQPTKRPQRLPMLDQDGLQLIPWRLKAIFCLCLRPYLVWLVTLTLPEAQRKAVLSFFYPASADFVRATLIAIPVLILLAALSQRVPFDQKLKRGRQPRFWSAIWRQGWWLLPAVVAVDLYWTVSHLPAFVALRAPGLLLLVVLLGLALLYLLSSNTVRVVYREWPEAKADLQTLTAPATQKAAE